MVAKQAEENSSASMKDRQSTFALRLPTPFSADLNFSFCNMKIYVFDKIGRNLIFLVPWIYNLIFMELKYLI